MQGKTATINDKIHKTLNDDKEDIHCAKNSLNGLKLPRNNLADAIAKTGFNQTLRDKMKSIEEQIAEYEAIIAEDNKTKAEIRVSREDVLEKINCLKAQMMNPKNAEQTKLLLQSYIERIVVDNNSVKVTLRLPFYFAMVTVQLKYATIIQSLSQEGY